MGRRISIGLIAVAASAGCAAAPAREPPSVVPTAPVPAKAATAPAQASARRPGEALEAPAPDAAAPQAEPTPEAPPYDLAADIEARKLEAHSELGKRTAVDVVEGVFVVASPSGSGALSSALGVTKLALAAYLNGRFEQRPARALSVYLFPDHRPYQAYCKLRWAQGCGTPYGFYRHDERRIVMNIGPGIGTLTHELVHPLVEADFPDAPDWINEGIASLFEQPYLGKKGEIHGGKNWRHPRLLQALRSKTEREHASLPALFSMSDPTFRGDLEDLNYATARYFCQWLDQKKLLWAFYQRWRDDHAGDPSGEVAFAAVVGKTPADADAEWVQWVKRL